MDNHGSTTMPPPPPPPSPPPLPATAAEPKRSNVCAVCSAVSEHFYLNYGAAACFSCRAFFRRANLNLKGGRNSEVSNPRAMVCKNGGRCEVTVSNRKCRKCRYDRCIHAGMDPGAVLDDDGKKARFRKMLKKKMMMPEEVRAAEISKSGRAKPWTKSKLTLRDGELEPPKKRGRKPRERPSPETLQSSSSSSSLSSSYTTSITQRERQLQHLQEIPPLLALAPRNLERAVRFQDEQAADCAAAGAASASAAGYESSRFHSQFHNGHFMDYSRFDAANYGDVGGPPATATGCYNNHGCVSEEQAFGSSIYCRSSSNLLAIATSTAGRASSDVGFDPSEEFELPAVKVEVEIKDEPATAMGDLTASDDSFLVKSEVLEVLREDDLAELNQNSEVTRLSRNGAISINFRSSTKPELFFILRDENKDSLSDCVLSAQSTSPWRFRGRVRKEMISKLQSYQKAWNLALRSMVITEPLLEGLLGLHRGFGELTKEMLKVHFVSLAKLFTDFASLQPEFSRLTKLDQRKYLTKNVGIFIQYVLCRYFASVKNGAADQINWMLVSKLQTTIGNENLDPISLENFNASLKIFESDKVLEYQSTIDEAAKLVEKFETQNNCTVALCFLYNMPISTHLNDPEAPDDLLSDVHTLVDWASEVYGSPGKDDVVALTAALENMLNVFDANTSWDTTDAVYSLGLWHEITLPYCAEEEHWTLQRFSLFQKAFHEIELGGDILNEFIYFTHDVPISKQFMPRAMTVFAERFRNLLLRMEEFSLLSPGQKKRALETCVFHSVGIFVAKLESCENGYQQLRFSVGAEGDDLTYTRDILNLTDARKLKKMCMKDVNPSTGNLDQETIQRFTYLLSKVIPLVKDLAAMKLMIFVLLFNELAEDGDQICVAIQQRYLTLLRRRLAHLRKSKEPQEVVDENNEEGEDLIECHDGSFEMFRSGMTHIKELSVIMHRLAMQKRDEQPQLAQQQPALI